MRFRKSALLFIICFYAGLLRFFYLDQIPFGISADEANFSYNAYSLLKTGHDEYGVRYPIIFQSFDDHKNFVLFYLLMPFVWWFGLNEWAIRLPSALIGVFIVFLFYGIGKRLTGKTTLSLLTAFFAASSAWLIQYSRVAVDMNVALALSLFGVLLFLRKKAKLETTILAGISLGLSFWTYYASKVWTILFVPFLAFFLKRPTKSAVVFIAIFFIIAAPYFFVVRSSSFLRQYGISVFVNRQEFIDSANLLLKDIQSGDWGGRLIHNRRLVWFNQAADGFLNVLSPSILFGRNAIHHNAQTRLLYVWQLPILIIGIWVLMRKRKLLFFLMVWLIVGYIPAAVTTHPPFDRRMLVNAFPIMLFTAYGVSWILEYSKQKKAGFITAIFLFVVILASHYIYVHYYFGHGKEEVIPLWGSGMKELVKKTNAAKESYERVVISMRLDQPMAYFLFYEAYPPDTFLAEGGRKTGGYVEEQNSYGNYRFKMIRSEDLAENTLYVWADGENQPCLSAFDTVYQSNGKPFAFIGRYEKQPNCQIP